MPVQFQHCREVAAHHQPDKGPVSDQERGNRVPGVVQILQQLQDGDARVAGKREARPAKVFVPAGVLGQAGGDGVDPVERGEAVGRQPGPELHMSVGELAAEFEEAAACGHDVGVDVFGRLDDVGDACTAQAEDWRKYAEHIRHDYSAVR